MAYVEIVPNAAAVTASTNDGNVPANAIDNKLSTRWSGNGNGAWLQIDLGSVRTIGHVKIAVHQGNARRNRFKIWVASDPTTATEVWSGESSGTTTQQETYDFTDIQGRYVRYVGSGYTSGGTNGTCLLYTSDAADE